MIIDDMIDTAGTLIPAWTRSGARAPGGSSPAASTACSPAPPSRVSRGRCSKSSSSPIRSRCTQDKQLAKIPVLSVAPLVAEAIRRIHDEESVSALFV